MRAKFGILVILLLMFSVTQLHSEEIKVIELSWDEVAGIVRLDNLSLQMAELDNKTAAAEVKKAWGSFLPSLDYQWLWSDDELTQAQMPVPADNMFGHSISMTYPLFVGGARYANLKMQQHLQKSMAAELEGLESDVVLNSLQAYFGVILAGSLVEVYTEAMGLAERNLSQVESFEGVGTATELEVMQARTRYFESIPQLESARNQRKAALNQLKMLLNIPAADSVLVKDTLSREEFLGGYARLQIEEYKNLARDNRAEVVQIHNQSKAVSQQKLLAASQFMPKVVLTAGRNFYAYSDDWWIGKDDFAAYNSVGLVVQMPIFQGGSRWFDSQEAGYASKKMALAKELTINQVELEAEQSYYAYLEAKDNLKSQEEALATAEESLRLANLYFTEGMVTQTEVLGAQLSYTNNRAALTSGIYNYNTSQLGLLRAIGDLASIWKK
ncbi:MAG: TolC family protein [Candidatus Cloacimonetes bacterium]|nr:TolC family protein [Candidatus Cloacimonadota bacterium]